MHQNFNAQSGRSMMEILGVIAIIGVLSIGGIKAYDTAKNNIGLNKLSEVMNLAIMSVEESKPIYESLREEDRKFGDKTVEATQLFAKTFGIKYKENDFIVDAERGGFGLPLGGNLLFRLKPVDTTQQDAQELFEMIISQRDVGNNAYDLSLKVLERMRETVRTNPSLRNRIRRLKSSVGHAYLFNCMADRLEIDRSFDTFLGRIKGDSRVNTLSIQFYYSN